MFIATEVTHIQQISLEIYIAKCMEPLHSISVIGEESRQIKQIKVTFQPFQLFPDLVKLMQLLSVEGVHVPEFQMLFRAKRAEQSFSLSQTDLTADIERHLPESLLLLQSNLKNQNQTITKKESLISPN